MKKLIKIKKYLLAITLIIILFIPKTVHAEQYDSAIHNLQTNLEQEKIAVRIKPEDIYEEITMVAVGDNLIHNSIIKSGKTEDGYDFDYMYKNIKDYINQFDLKVINQETVLINDASKYSGYPQFGSPIQIGEAAINAGFNMVTQATNHAYDKREQGILDSLNFWQEHDIHVLGIHDKEENVYIYETKTMKIALLNYTYGLNGFSLPSDKQYLVDLLYSDKVWEDLKYAEENADITIVFVHWGTEYTHKETKEQKRMAKLLADNGADLIIGCHPHVIEPLKTIIAEDGREVPCFYSLGNFVSAQSEPARMLGAAAEVKITNNNGNVIFETKMKPLVTHIQKGYSSYSAYLLDDYTEELASMHQHKSKGLSVEMLWSLWNDVTKNND